VYYRLKLSQDTQLKAAISLLSQKGIYAELLKPKMVVQKESEKQNTSVQKTK
jgi:hypothetical protein